MAKPSRLGKTSAAVAEPVAVSPSPVRRSKGRPRAEDAKIGREEIIAATVELLKTTPLNKMTSAAIARRLGAHPALINYYFKSRSELLVATVTQLMRDLRAESDFTVIAKGDARTRLRARLAGILDFHRRFPFIHRMIVDEVLNSTSPAAKAVMRDLTDVGLRGYSEFVRESVASGELREVDPTFLYIATIGMAEFFNSGAPIVRHASRDKEPPEALSQRYLDFMLDTLLLGMAPRDQAKASASQS